ncbi:hypothetical protein ACNVED_15620 (plasmid) [Legionella sp. D16C41]|uniref:hypothetical protein n=1 Tax=Legionella sp. D16C41 TaxID=3402688 RepID=UPI003AF7D4E2
MQSNLPKNVDLFDAIKSLSPEITLLDLSLQNLGNKSINELISLLSIIPDHVTTLDVSWNFFYNFSGKALARVIGATACGVSTLIFGWNNFATKTGNQLREIFTAIPSHIHSLTIKGSISVSDDDLVAALPSLPPHITSLSLEANCLHEIIDTILLKLKGGLPSIKTLQLSYNEVKAMSLQRIQLLKAVFPNIEHIIFLDNMGKQVDVDDSILSQRYTWEFNAKQNVPSLLSWAAFYAIKDKNINNKIHIKNDEQKVVPEEVLEVVNTIPKNFFN